MNTLVTIDVEFYSKRVIYATNMKFSIFDRHFLRIHSLRVLEKMISARFTMIRGPIDFVLQRENRRVWPARVQTRPFSIFSRCGAREPERTVLAPLHLRTIFL